MIKFDDINKSIFKDGLSIEAKCLTNKQNDMLKIIKTNKTNSQTGKRTDRGKKEEEKAI